MHAVMYVITAPVKAGNPFHLSWSELHRMQNSGRWDIQPHAHDGHRLIVTDPAGDTGAVLRGPRATPAATASSRSPPTRSASPPTSTTLKDDFKAQGLGSDTFAVPFGDHGQSVDATRASSSSWTSCSRPSSASRSSSRTATTRATRGPPVRRSATSCSPRPRRTRCTGGSCGTTRRPRTRRREHEDAPVHRARARRGRSARPPRPRPPPSRSPSRRPRAARAMIPRTLTFERGVRATSGVLRWKPAKAAARRRRHGAAAGRDLPRLSRRPRRRADAALSMSINVRVGRTYRLTIGAVARPREVDPLPRADRRAGPLLPCALDAAAGERRRDGRARARRSAGRPSQPGDSPIAAYRVLREGAVFKQTPATSVPVPLSSNRTARFTVTAIDRRGVMSAPSEAVTVTTGHTPPPVPTGLHVTETTDSAVALEWTPSVPARGRLAGYRVLRDGKPLFQVAATAARATNLFAGRAYTFSVQAIDTLGGASAATEPLTRAHPRPRPDRGPAARVPAGDAPTRASTTSRTTTGRSGRSTRRTTTARRRRVMTGQDDPLVTGWAQARRVEVMPRFNCQRTSVLNRIVNDPALRAAWIDEICQRVADSGADGASIDFEAGLAADRDAYTSFVNDLADAAARAGPEADDRRVGEDRRRPEPPALDVLRLQGAVRRRRPRLRDGVGHQVGHVRARARRTTSPGSRRSPTT